MSHRSKPAQNATTVPEGAGDDFGWTLFVVHHDEHALPPMRQTLGRSQVATFARGGGSFGDGLPLDARLSRRHARFLVDGTGALYVVDEGSRNGVHRLGERITYAALVAGDVIRIGGFLLVAQPTPLRFDASDDAAIPLPGAASARLVQALRAHARGEARHLLLLGESGCAAEVAAKVWANAAGVPLDPAEAPGDVGAMCLQVAHNRSRRSGSIERSRRAIAWCSPRRARPSDRSTSALGGAGDRAPHAAPRATRRRARGALRALEGPRLRRRVALGRAGDRAAAGPVARQRRAAPPGRRRARGAGSTTPPCRRCSLPIRTRAPRTTGAPWWPSTGAASGTTAGEGVDLRQRPVLARILRALATADEPRSVDDLIAAAWPGANLVGDSGSARVYAAIATLRRFGLRDALVREEEGYRLDPHLTRIEPDVHSIS